MDLSVEVLADSYNNEAQSRLTTMRIQAPEWVFKDVVRHRCYSFSVSSTRAENVQQARERTIANPAIPSHFVKNAKGMVGKDEYTREEQEAIRMVFHQAMNAALEFHQDCDQFKLSKQDQNILIGSFLPTCFIVTGTEWKNFFRLRTATDAKPEVQDLAALMRDRYNLSLPDTISTGWWHTPLVYTDPKRDKVSQEALDVSAARCAQQSYPGSTSKPWSEALAMAAFLKQAPHLTPFEHPAQALPRRERCGPLVGFRSYRMTLPGEGGGDYEDLWSPVDDFADFVQQWSGTESMPSATDLVKMWRACIGY